MVVPSSSMSVPRICPRVMGKQQTRERPSISYVHSQQYYCANIWRIARIWQQQTDIQWEISHGCNFVQIARIWCLFSPAYTGKTKLYQIYHFAAINFDTKREEPYAYSEWGVICMRFGTRNAIKQRNQSKKLILYSELEYRCRNNNETMRVDLRRASMITVTRMQFGTRKGWVDP